MLRTFIRFGQVNYCGDRECPVDETCFNSSPEYESSLPAIEGDSIKFIADKSEFDFWDAQHMKIGISDECGVFIQECGVVEQGGSQYFITATVPVLTGAHRFVLYNSLNIQLLSIFRNDVGCGGVVTFEIPTAPAEIFEWSADGENWQESSTFTELCLEGVITIYVRIQGEECTVGEVGFDFDPINCLDYKGWTLQQFQDAGIRLFQMYDCLLEDIQP